MGSNHRTQEASESSPQGVGGQPGPLPPLAVDSGPDPPLASEPEQGTRTDDFVAVPNQDHGASRRHDNRVPLIVNPSPTPPPLVQEGSTHITSSSCRNDDEGYSSPTHFYTCLSDGHEVASDAMNRPVETDPTETAPQHEEPQGQQTSQTTPSSFATTPHNDTKRGGDGQAAGLPQPASDGARGAHGSTTDPHNAAHRAGAGNGTTTAGRDIATGTEPTSGPAAPFPAARPLAQPTPPSGAPRTPEFPISVAQTTPAVPVFCGVERHQNEGTPPHNETLVSLTQPGDAHTYAYTLTDCDIILPVHLLHGPSRSAPGALHFHDADGRLHAEALMAIAGGNRVYASMGGDSRVHSIYGPLSLTGARRHADTKLITT